MRNLNEHEIKEISGGIIVAEYDPFFDTVFYYDDGYDYYEDIIFVDNVWGPQPVMFAPQPFMYPAPALFTIVI